MTQCKDLNIIGTSILLVTSITGPTSVTIGETATFTAIVTNSGTASGSTDMTFYEDVGSIVISTQTTGTIIPGGTQNLHVNINTSTWALGNFNICAKTTSESTYTTCRTFNITDIIGASILSVTDITGPTSVTTETATATFTATVANSGSASGSANVAFYKDVGSVVISTQTTGTIAPGGTQNVAATVTISTWSVGTYSICAKTSQELTYTICKAFEVTEETTPPPAAEAGGSAILIGGLAVGALIMLMSKKK